MRTDGQTEKTELKSSIKIINRVYCNTNYGLKYNQINILNHLCIFIKLFLKEACKKYHALTPERLPQVDQIPQI